MGGVVSITPPLLLPKNVVPENRLAQKQTMALTDILTRLLLDH